MRQKGVRREAKIPGNLIRRKKQGANSIGPDSCSQIRFFHRLATKNPYFRWAGQASRLIFSKLCMFLVYDSIFIYFIA